MLPILGQFPVLLYGMKGNKNLRVYGYTGLVGYRKDMVLFSTLQLYAHWTNYLFKLGVTFYGYNGYLYHAIIRAHTIEVILKAWKVTALKQLRQDVVYIEDKTATFLNQLHHTMCAKLMNQAIGDISILNWLVALSTFYIMQRLYSTKLRSHMKGAPLVGRFLVNVLRFETYGPFT